MTSKELAEKTVKDINKKRAAREEAKRQATAHSIENMYKIQRRLR